MRNLRLKQTKKQLSLRVEFEFPTQPRDFEEDLELDLSLEPSSQFCQYESLSTKDSQSQSILKHKKNSSFKGNFMKTEKILLKKKNIHQPKAQNAIQVSQHLGKEKKEFGPLDRVDGKYLSLLKEYTQMKGEELTYEDLVKMFFPKKKISGFDALCSFRLIENYVLELD